MEKIVITEINKIEQEGKDTFWGVVLSDKRKATVWDSQIAADIAINLNWATEAVVKQQGAFLNIREFKAERKALDVPAAKKAPEVPLPEVSNIESIDTETGGLQFEAKSSVKLKKMAKGMQWEIKVVVGEEALIVGLREAAITAHKALEAEFPVLKA